MWAGILLRIISGTASTSGGTVNGEIRHQLCLINTMSVTKIFKKNVKNKKKIFFLNPLHLDWKVIIKW